MGASVEIVVGVALSFVKVRYSVDSKRAPVGKQTSTLVTFWMVPMQVVSLKTQIWSSSMFSGLRTSNTSTSFRKNCRIKVLLREAR
jgi:hypothetical protein